MASLRQTAKATIVALTVGKDIYIIFIITTSDYSDSVSVELDKVSDLGYQG